MPEPSTRQQRAAHAADRAADLFSIAAGAFAATATLALHWVFDTPLPTALVRGGLAFVVVYVLINIGWQVIRRRGVRQDSDKLGLGVGALMATVTLALNWGNGVPLDTALVRAVLTFFLSYSVVAAMVRVVAHIARKEQSARRAGEQEASEEGAAEEAAGAEEAPREPAEEENQPA